MTIPQNAPRLILDEPTSFMDIPSKQLLIEILTDWMDQGERGIVMASHQIADIMKLADYLYVLQDGKQFDTFEKEELLQCYRIYWVAPRLPEEPIPSEVARENQSIISEAPNETEAFFRDRHVTITHQTALDPGEILSYLLEQP